MAGRTRMGRRAVRAGLAAATLALAGAVVAGGPDAAQSAPVWQRVTVLAPPGANQGAETRLDIVLVHDVALMPLMPVTAAQWFDQRAALLATAGRGLGVASLKVRPGSQVPAVKLPPGAARAAGALVYAGLPPGSGPTAAPLAPHRCVRILLTQQLAQQAC